MVSYPKIFKQAYEITRNNKFLWIFGLFLSLANLLILQDEEKMNVSLPIWVTLLLILVFLVIYFRCRVALVIGIKAVIDKKEISVKKAYKPSRLYYIQVMGISVVIELAIVILGLIIFMPVQSIYNSGNESLAYSFGIVALLIFIPFAVSATFVNVLAPLFVIIFDLKPNAAVKKSMDLISAHWQKLIVVGVLLFLPQVFLFGLSYPVVFLSELPYIIVAGLVLLTAQTLLAVFQQTAWVLTFLELVRPQKFEDEVPEVAPEIAS